MADLQFNEIPLTELRQNPQLWQAFLAVQAPWIAAGVTRWLDRVRPDGPWPVLVVAATRPEAPQQLLGTIVGVWAQEPVQRFDDLLETRCPQGFVGVDRPDGGVWHFIAATVAPDAAGLNLGRRLVGAALDWLKLHAPHAQARTLSPAVGLPHLTQLLGEPHAVRDAVLHLANDKGQPALEILRLHLGAGATLDAMLLDSRQDEVRSGRVTLRFAYATDGAMRAAQKLRYEAWLNQRAAQIAAGNAQKLAMDLWLVQDAGDANIAAC
jgi:GNAT superfamily N-acetyltransferase